MSVQTATITTYAPTYSGAVSRVTLVSQAVTGPAGTGSGSGDLLAANNLDDVADADTARSNLGAVGSTTIDTIVTLTQAAYDALGAGRPSTTLYLVTP